MAKRRKLSKKARAAALKNLRKARRALKQKEHHGKTHRKTVRRKHRRAHAREASEMKRRRRRRKHRHHAREAATEAKRPKRRRARKARGKTEHRRKRRVTAKQRAAARRNIKKAIAGKRRKKACRRAAGRRGAAKRLHRRMPAYPKRCAPRKSRKKGRRRSKRKHHREAKTVRMEQQSFAFESHRRRRRHYRRRHNPLVNPLESPMEWASGVAGVGFGAVLAMVLDRAVATHALTANTPGNDAAGYVDTPPTGQIYDSEAPALPLWQNPMRLAAAAGAIAIPGIISRFVGGAGTKTFMELATMGAIGVTVAKIAADVVATVMPTSGTALQLFGPEIAATAKLTSLSSGTSTQQTAGTFAGLPRRTMGQPQQRPAVGTGATPAAYLGQPSRGLGDCPPVVHPVAASHPGNTDPSTGMPSMDIPSRFDSLDEPIPNATLMSPYIGTGDDCCPLPTVLPDFSSSSEPTAPPSPPAQSPPAVTPQVAQPMAPSMPTTLPPTPQPNPPPAATPQPTPTTPQPSGSANINPGILHTTSTTVSRMPVSQSSTPPRSGSSSNPR